MKQFEEQHLETLQEALRQLPKYEAPAAVWTHVTAMLDEAPLQNAMALLPEHEAPASVWTGVLQNLDREQTQRLRFRLLRRSALWAVAASTLLLVAGWWLLRPSSELRLSQEWVDDRLLAPLRENDESALQWLNTICSDEQILCREPRFKALKSELEELNEAEKKLRSALGPYGDDPELVGDLVRLERAQNDIVQQLLAMI